MTAQNVALQEADFPGLYQAADSASLRGQRHFMRAVKWRLLSVLLAAAFGLLTTYSHYYAIASALAFLSALLIELYILKEKPERVWYDGRALAESAKSLTWRYAVGAAPYQIGSATEDAAERFRQQIRELLRDAPQTGITATDAPVVSKAVRRLRSSPLCERRRAYLQGRIIDQQCWYAKKAEFNRIRALRWRLVLLGVELAGFLAAMIHVSQVINIDLAGVAAALIGAGAAWLTTKQHESLAHAYSFTSNELSIIRDRLEGMDHEDEDLWSTEIGDAEEAISREHTMWRASRSSVR
ncbi:MULTISPECIES: DUF4231 domain-containing protein [Streptomyces]|uniref:DUF4231 domain-containing protein n=1 Tax=Streptomyces TaxID=1883 RepID=UPI000ACB371C|nr:MULTISPECIES: DUF4231 domain-containing protein [Streptomyces]